MNISIDVKFLDISPRRILGPFCGKKKKKILRTRYRSKVRVRFRCEKPISSSAKRYKGARAGEADDLMLYTSYQTNREAARAHLSLPVHRSLRIR